MPRKTFIISLLFLLAASLIHTQQAVNTVNLSSRFSNVAGTPRALYNEDQNHWIVTWRQQGSPSKILSRIMNPDGSKSGRKKLVSKVSSSPQNFDLAYDSTNGAYLLVYEAGKGLTVQRYNQNRAKQGSAIVVVKDVSGVIPRLAYDAAGEKFLLFWLDSKDGIEQKVFKSMLLDSSGKPTTGAKTLKTSPSGKTYASHELSVNSKNGNLLAMLLELGEDASGNPVGSVIGLNIKPNGSLLRKKPLKFQPNTVDLLTSGNSSFADNNGKGFAIWADRTSIKYRKLSAKGKFNSPTLPILNSADLSSAQPSIVYDSVNNKFVGVWALGKTIRTVGIDPAGEIVQETSTVVTAPDAVASSANVHSSFDPQTGNFIAVWEDVRETQEAARSTAEGQKFQVRASVFSVAGSGGGDDGGGGGGGTFRVSAVDNSFSPRTITISVGTTVIWTNAGNNLHTVTSGTPDNAGAVFDSPGVLSPGAQFSFTFNTAGQFDYFCRIHGLAMTGTVIVQ